MFQLSEQKVSSSFVLMWSRIKGNDLLAVELSIAVAAKNFQEVRRIVESRDHWSQRDLESALGQLNNPYGMVLEMVLAPQEAKTEHAAEIIKLLRSVKTQE